MFLSNVQHVLAIFRPVSRLDVPTRLDRGFYRAILVEDVVEGVVIIAHSRNRAKSESNVPRCCDVAGRRVARHRVALVALEKADRLWVGRADLVRVESCVQVCGVDGTVDAFDEREGVGTETVVCVEVARARLSGIIAGVMCHCFCQTE